MSLVKFQETDILLDELVELSVVSCNQNPHWRNVLFVLGLGLNERLKDLATVSVVNYILVGSFNIVVTTLAMVFIVKVHTLGCT